MKFGINYKYEFTVKPKQVWDYLHGIYGGTEIKRRVVKLDSMSNIDLNLVMIYISVIPIRSQWNTKITPPKLIYTHKDSTNEDLKQRIVDVLSLPTYNIKLDRSSIRLWKYDGNKKVENYIQSLEGYNVSEKQYIPPNEEFEGSIGLEFDGYCLEFMKNKCVEGGTCKSAIFIEQAEEGKFIFKKPFKAKVSVCAYCKDSKPLTSICKCKQVFYCSVLCMLNDKQYHLRLCKSLTIEDEPSKIAQKYDSCMGNAGLQNIGNTCFMNSGLQCLSHSTPLTYYFLKNYFEADLNPNNPLGSKCYLAKAYAKLIKDMWYDNSKVVHPSVFKTILGKVNDAFRGFHQHDSQELISCVLDIIHEDLNRIKTKPTVESKSYSDDKLLKIGSKECWQGFLQRNQSIIVDFFYGQFISRLKCPKCGILSYQFDPFSIVSIPIPCILKSEIDFDYIPYNLTETRLSGKVQSNKGDTIAQFRVAVAKLLNIDPYSFIVACLDIKTLDVERLLSNRHPAKKVAKLYKKKNDRIVLLQINPAVWKSSVNIGFEAMKSEALKKCSLIKETKKQEERGSLYGFYNEPLYACTEEEFDFNNGIDYNVIKVQAHIRCEDCDTQELVYPRFIYIKKSSTLIELHLQLFQMIRPLINKYASSHYPQVNYATMCLEEAYGSLFKLNLSQQNAMPYRVQINTYSNKKVFMPCCFCKEKHGNRCALPKKSTTIEEFIKCRAMGKFSKYSDNNLYYSSYGFSEKLDFEIVAYFEANKLHEICNDKVEEMRLLVPISTTKETPKPKQKTLDDCLSSFSMEEQLGEEDTWYCSNCKEHVRAWKKMQINKAPHLLIIHLKRFKGKKIYSTAGKIEESIDCPVDYDFGKHILDNEGKTTHYTLYAVVNHSGSLGFGHYTANCYNHIKKCWYAFNDSYVYEITDNPVSGEAYVLFYKRADLDFEIQDFNKFKQIQDIPKAVPSTATPLQNENNEEMKMKD